MAEKKATEKSKMNLFQKIQRIRVELQDLDLKKTGENKYAGFKYYELADFLPELNKLSDKYGVCNCISFDNEYATLIIYDSDSEQTLKFTSPMRELELKGCNAIQGLGGVETYSRRYLYLTAYEIVENDFSDAVAGNAQFTSKTTPQTDKKATDAQLRVIQHILTQDEKIAIQKKYDIPDLINLTVAQASAIIKRKKGE